MSSSGSTFTMSRREAPRDRLSLRLPLPHRCRHSKRRPAGLNQPAPVADQDDVGEAEALLGDLRSDGFRVPGVAGEDLDGDPLFGGQRPHRRSAGAPARRLWHGRVHRADRSALRRRPKRGRRARACPRSGADTRVARRRAKSSTFLERTRSQTSPMHSQILEVARRSTSGARRAMAALTGSVVADILPVMLSVALGRQLAMQATQRCHASPSSRARALLDRPSHDARSLFGGRSVRPPLPTFSPKWSVMTS